MPISRVRRPPLLAPDRGMRDTVAAMQTFFVTLLLFGAVVTLMSVGVIFSNRRLRGSCGGTGQDCHCDDQKRKACPHAPDAAG